MKQRLSLKKALAVVLCLLMLASVVPMNAFAVIENYNKDYQSETHTVFKHTEQTLAPGVTNYTNYAYSSDGKQMVYYVTTADLTRDDVVAQVAYKDMQNDVYGMDKLSNMVACANEKYTNPNDPLYISDYYTVVSACNGDGYNMTTGEPGGVFIMGGNVKKDWNKASNPVFLAILKDGSAVIDNTQEAWDACKEAGIQEAIDIFGSNLVWDGKDVTANASGSYNTDRHSRTMVGITEDGKLVICVLDGRQEPFSCGGSMHELAQIMLEAGCVRAFNLDGGGSTTFMAKNEGTNDCVVINRPSDGSERSISNGIIIASTAAPSNTFDHVSMVADNEFVTPGSSTSVKVTGVSPAGTAAEIPADITYEVANGSFENGVLTSSAVGDVVLTAKYDGKAVGSLTVNSVIPEQIKFSSDSITVPYGKTAELELIATYGLNEVVTKASDFSFTLENASAGVVDGLSFTACDESTGITGSAITAAFVGSDLTAEAQLVFGKGSEVIFDFEDGTTNGFKTGYGSYNYYLPNSETSVVTAENGKVHSGNYALAVNIDYSNSQESGYMMTALYRVGSEDEEADRPLVGAQRVGAWIYIPDEYVGLWARWVLYPISSVNEDGTVNIAASSITSNAMDNTTGGTGVVYSFNESGWHYLSCDFSQYAGAMWRDGYYCMQFYISDRDGASYNYYAKENHNINGDFTIYMDDFTVDYSSVIDDRDVPVFSGVSYATHGMSDAAVLNDGANIGYNTVDFTASVADDMTKTNATGLDASTAKAYVDGNEVACTYKNGSIAMDNSAVLTAGEHTIKFSICDKQGNYASVIRKVNITTGNASAIKVVAHDSSLNRILFGSLYYVDVVADNIENVQSVTTTLNLDSMSKWELDHMVVADGFEATYTYEPADKILHLTLTKTGDVSATGEQALVSIPVRVWELKNAGSLIGGSTDVLPEENQYTYSWFKSQNEYWRVAVEVRIQQGYVTLADGATETFTGEHVFCDTEAWAIQKFMVETQEGKDYKAAWNGGHIHTITALADKAATCTETGYTGRTFCEVCNSVVDWGTTVPATGHTYDFVDGVLKCTCGELFNGEFEGKTYVDGVVVSGWIGDSYYVNGEKLTGVQLVDGYYYDFGENGVCEGKAKYTGLFFDETADVYRYAEFGTVKSGWKMINDEWYLFRDKTLAAETDKFFNGYVTYHFEETGRLISGEWYEDENGKMYFYGPDKYKALNYNKPFVIDGNTYYFNKNGRVVTGIQYVPMDAVNYRWCDLGTDGIYRGNLNGIHTLTDGKLYYLNDGVKVKAGAVRIGDDIYYFGMNYYALADGAYYLPESMMNGVLPAGTYVIQDGKIIIRNGMYEENGKLYYFVNNNKVKAGAVRIGDDIYYFGMNYYALPDGTYYITGSMMNGLLPAGTYLIQDGKIIVRNGMYEENGKLYYFENNNKVKAGAVRIGDDIYYFGMNYYALPDGTYYITESMMNGLLPAGTYLIQDGKIIVRNGMYEENGKLYYFENNNKVKAGAVRIGDDIYYFGMNYYALADGTYYLPESMMNGILPAGTYLIQDGKIIVRNGMYEENGKLYYFVNNNKVKAGAVQIGDDIYYFGMNYYALPDGTYYITESMMNGLLPAGTYRIQNYKIVVE